MSKKSQSGQSAPSERYFGFKIIIPEYPKDREASGVFFVKR